MLVPIIATHVFKPLDFAFPTLVGNMYKAQYICHSSLTSSVLGPVTLYSLFSPAYLAHTVGCQ